MADRELVRLRQGDPHTMIIAAGLGESVTDMTCAASLYRLPGGRNSYTPATTAAETYTVTTFAGDATRGPGWYLTMDSTETAALKPGVYVGTPSLTLNAQPVATPASWLVEVSEV